MIEAIADDAFTTETHCFYDSSNTDRITQHSPNILHPNASRSIRVRPAWSQHDAPTRTAGPETRPSVRVRSIALADRLGDLSLTDVLFKSPTSRSRSITPWEARHDQASGYRCHWPRGRRTGACHRGGNARPGDRAGRDSVLGLLSLVFLSCSCRWLSRFRWLLPRQARTTSMCSDGASAFPLPSPPTAPMSGWRTTRATR
jgi:hypothetical protein